MMFDIETIGYDPILTGPLVITVKPEGSCLPEAIVYFQSVDSEELHIVDLTTPVHDQLKEING